jgi:hypothetical protein
LSSTDISPTLITRSSPLVVSIATTSSVLRDEIDESAFSIIYSSFSISAVTTLFTVSSDSTIVTSSLYTAKLFVLSSSSRRLWERWR